MLPARARSLAVAEDRHDHPEGLLGRRRGRTAAPPAAMLVLLTLLYFAFTFLQVWHASKQDEPVPAGAIVVLGAAQYNGRPSPALAARLDRAVALYGQRLAPIVVATGGAQSGDRFTEAGAGGRYLVARGVPDSALRLEVQGRNTWESLAATARFLKAEGVTEVLLVSDSYHSYRVAAIAREVGLMPHVAPTHVGQASLRDLTRETVAVAVGRFLGYRRLTNLDRAIEKTTEAAGG